jgi:F420-dependent oxidoreductase-like protein
VSDAPIRLVAPTLVVLVGAPGSGKSTWAQAQFPDHQVVSTDRLRALVGEGEGDQRASGDAFALLADVLERRLRRNLLTVVDSTGLDAAFRQQLVATAQRFGVPCIAVLFDVTATTALTQNRLRYKRVSDTVVRSMVRQFATAALSIPNEGFSEVHVPGPVRVVPPTLATADSAYQRQLIDPLPLRFGLQISRFSWPGAPESTAGILRSIAKTAEDAGFASLWVMDHFRQIPQVGRPWEDMLESYTTLAYLAAVTDRVRLGTLVTGITYRNVAHLAKIVATLDVLSDGRAVCGLGAAWFEQEHRAYGWDFPPLRDRYALLQDALELLPLMWGKGTPAYEGRVLSVPEAMCYPRPLQARIPILVGGSGEKRTLRLVAKYADACNLFGDPSVIAHKISVLHAHCAQVGRDPSQIEITQLSELPMNVDVADQIGRFRELAEAGVHCAIIPLSDPATLESFRDVIAAFH